MKNKNWIIIDTETTGLSSPIFVVEIAAQRMRGWEPSGKPFRCLINQNEDIPAEASRVHGYTREILERDGELPSAAYQAFAEYTENLPIVAYNLKYDWDTVLLPEWKRLGITPIGVEGFCALRLAQRLLDPVPAGNCKLQTLRQFYRLPERGAHTALGDVDTVADLMQHVLRPLAEEKALISWDEVSAFAKAEYFPIRIPFGKFKGRDYRDAEHDSGLMEWIEWLSSSSNGRSKAMGKWYMKQLSVSIGVAASASPSPQELADGVKTRDNGSVSPFQKIEKEQLQVLIEQARVRLADLQTTYTIELSEVSAVKAQIFELVRDLYQERDSLRLTLDHLKLILDKLCEGEDETEKFEEEHQSAQAENQKSYEEAANATVSKKKVGDNHGELTTLWRKLVGLFHPDKHAMDPNKKQTFENLTAAINLARDEGNLTILNEIASDPDAFILKQGWNSIDLEREVDLKALESLYANLQIEIIELIELSDNLRKSQDFELMMLTKDNASLPTEVAEKQKSALLVEIKDLEKEVQDLRAEIKNLTGNEAPFGG